MVATPTVVQRKRCSLCLGILEIANVSDSGDVSRVPFEHKPDACAASTLQRIKVLEEMHHRDMQELEQQKVMIDQLGAWIGATGDILDAGGKWLVHRAQRAEDIARLRNAFGTQDRALQHPLWQAEEAVAGAIRAAMELVEKRSKS